MSPSFFLRYFLGHWRAFLILFVWLLLVGALAAGLPAYAATNAGQGLEQRLTDAPFAARNILISGTGLNEPLFERIQDSLGGLLRDRVEVREIEVSGKPVIFTTAGERPFDEFFAVHPYAVTELERFVNVLEGRLPDAGGETIEAAIGPDAAANINFSTAEGNSVTFYNLQLGDEVETADGRRVRIVGIVEPLEPASDAWWGTLLPFRFLREARNGASMPETVSLSLLIRPEDMLSRFPGHSHEWRLLTETSEININNVAVVQARLREVETQLVNNFLRVDSSLLDIIEAYLGEVRVARVSLFLLAAQALLFGVLALLMVGSDLTRRDAAETVALRNRGYSRSQLILLFAAATLALSTIAALLAPLLARLVLTSWGLLSGRMVAGAISRDAWLLGALAVAVSWILLIAGYFLATRQMPSTWPTGRVQEPHRSVWQRYYLDLFLMVAGGALYWQSRNGGGTGMAGMSFSGGVDPLLLLGPTLLLAGLALLFLRLYPPLIRWLARRFANGNASLIPYGLTHIGRAPIDTARVVLLVSLAVGLAVFSSVWQVSLRERQSEIAHYVAGADVRIGVPNSATAADVAAVAGQEGVQSASPVYLNSRTRWAPELTRLATLVAVDPATFGDVARFAPDTSNLTLADILPALEVPGSQAIPAVFSYDTYPTDRAVGDIVTYVVGTDRLDFEVRGLIRSFPAANGAFIITNLGLLEQQVDLSLLSEPWIGQKEIWVQAAPGQRDQVEAAIAAGQGPTSGRVTDSAAAVERRLQNVLVGQQTAAAFSLNGWSVGLISVGAFALVFYFAARRRDGEFGVLRIVGYSPRQVAGLLVVEGLVALALGLLAGTIIGIGLAELMRPLLSSTLSAAVGGDVIHRLVIDWGNLLRLLVLLALGYGLALVVTIALLTRRQPLPDHRLAVE